MNFFQKVHQRYRYSAILLRELVRTDFKIRYQNSVLGYLWSLLRPLFMFVILYFIFVKFLHIGSNVPHWPIALLLGIVFWNFFNEMTKTGLKSVVAQAGVMRKVNFPKYIVILSTSASALINLGLNLVIIIVFAILTHVNFHWGMLMILVLIFEMFLFGLGCAFVLSTLFVKLRDIDFVWDIFLQGGFYASAVLFPMSRVAHESALGAKLLLLNPTAQIIQDSRYFLTSGNIPTTSSYYNHSWYGLIPIAIVIVLLVFGAWYFRRYSSTFAEEV